MKLTFDSYEEWLALREAAHDACLYWTKVRQMCQGKINLNVNGEPTHYDEAYAVSQMIKSANILNEIEHAPHPDYDDECQPVAMVYPDPDDISCMVAKIKRIEERYQFPLL